MKRFAALGALQLALACSSGPISVGDDRSSEAGLEAGAGGGAGAGGDTSITPTVDTLLPLLEPCERISNGLLMRRAGTAKDVPVCGLRNAVYWTSQFAVDCDGKRTAICNDETDPASTDNTDGKDSQGESLDPVAVPYVEIPVPSATFDYEAAGLRMGSVVAVTYRDRLVYGVLANLQQADVIGAGSYALADLLGINPDPVRGGLQTKDVTYVAFTGPENVVPAAEDVAATAALAESATAALIAAGRD